MLTDGTTEFTLKTHFALRPLNRVNVYNLSKSLTSDSALLNYIKSKKVCSLLVPIPDKMNPSPTSVVGQLSGHWYPDLVNQNLTVSPEFVDITDSLLTMGWTKTFVPPFYWLYENPNSG